MQGNMRTLRPYHCCGILFFIFILVTIVVVVIILATTVANPHVHEKPTYQNPVLKKSENEKFNVPGITNFGNTCYINSSLQALLNEPKIQDMFNEKKHSEHCSKTDFCFSCDFEKLCEKYRNSEMLVPEQLNRNQQALGILEFIPGEQQDAARFLLNFMQKLREEKNCGTKTPFEHDFQTETKCLVCENSSIVPHKSEDNLYTIEPKESIDAALKHYALGETPEYPKNYFECPHCDQGTPFWKNEVMATPPEVLVLQIQRIRGDDSSTGKDFRQQSNPLDVEKDTTPVQLTKTIDSSPLFSKSKETTNETYDLTGVICHLGGANGGHWIAFVKDQNGWLECNDSKVTRVLESRVLDEKQANILVYRRSQPMLQGI